MISLVFLFLGLNLIFADFESAEKYVNQLPNKNQYSIYIEELKSEKKLLHNETKQRVPASLTKLAVLGAALRHYPMSWKFQNQIYIKRKAKDGVLKDPICFKAVGDPSLVSEKMWVLANDIHRKGIRKIPKGIIIDTSLHSDVKRDSGRSKKRVSRAYDAPVSAASFNWNTVNIYIEPTKIGENAKVYLDPKSSYFILKNEIKTVKGKKKNLKHSIKMTRQRKGEQVHLRLKGSIGIENPEEIIYRNIQHPVLWTGHNFISFLRRRGIEISDKVQEKSCENYKYKIIERDSKAISLIYRDMMKFSNNFVTELLVKNMPLVKAKKASFKKGKSLIDQYLKDLGIKSMQISSVSGLSYKNKMSVLDAAYILKDLKSSKYNHEALQTLPIAGVDGTLKSRFSFFNENQILRAKTGMLSSVIGLAGVLKDNDKEYIVAILYNGKAIYKARSETDSIIRKLLE